jgi:hypothetical protein
MNDSSWYSLVFNPKSYIDTEKATDMTKSENYTFEEISEEWENFENKIIDFVTRCRSFFGKSRSFQ